MTDQDPLRQLRDLPLPHIAPELSARIRRDARRRLEAGRRRGAAPGRFARGAVAAAVVVLCVSHLGWTVTFLSRMETRSSVSPVFAR